MELKEILGIFAGLLVPILSILWFAMRSKIMNAVYEMLKPRDEKALETEKKVDKNTNNIEHMNSNFEKLLDTMKENHNELKELIDKKDQQNTELIKEKDKKNTDNFKIIYDKLDKKADKK